MMKNFLMVCVVCVIGFTPSAIGQIDTFSLQYLSDTLVVSDHPLSNQFKLRHNSVYVTKDAKELAGTFDDPSRVLKRSVGISTGNDQANGIIYHGLPSDFTKWTIHGAEIVNPNHTSNAGTFSDLSSQSAGGVLGIPFDVINTFSFHANTHVENTPTTVGGVANFNFLSESENFFKVGLLGLELGTQSKKSKIPIKTHFRYSTVGLLGQLGVDFGGEKIAFSDGFLQAGLTEHLNLISGGGFSSNIFRGVNEFSDAEFQKDLMNVDFKSYFFYSGLVFEKKRMKHSLMFSNKQDTRTAESDFIFVNPKAEFRNYKISYAGKIPIFPNDIKNFDVLINSSYSDMFQMFPESNLQTYTNFMILALRYRWFNDRYSFSAKLGPKVEFYNEEITPEISLIASRQFSSSSIELGSSLTSQEQTPEVFGSGSNRGLQRNKSFNASVSYKAEFIKNQKFLVQLFYHHLYDLPLNTLGFSPTLNVPYLNDFPTLENLGVANNYGIEMMYDQQFENGFYLNANVTLFDFRHNRVVRQELENDLNASTNFNYIANFNFSKSWKVKSENDFLINSAFHIRGGGYDYFNRNSALQLSPYNRLDLRIQYEFGKSILSLDIQNLLNQKNDGFYYFDEFLDETVLQQQLGLIPVFSWKRSLS